MVACYFLSAMKAFATDRQQIWIYEVGGGAVFPHKLEDALDLLHSEAEYGLFQDIIERLLLSSYLEGVDIAHRHARQAHGAYDMY
ncbi:hypothetical protein M5K25_023144 [Dendrobium thyrsiflorum]|uniref:Uncharacterized protein n=1 Tax=Dendrobium thyrsiflorum TaxID=117978 RepID=A0ABD0U7F2_DENTH